MSFPATIGGSGRLYGLVSVPLRCKGGLLFFPFIELFASKSHSSPIFVLINFSFVKCLFPVATACAVNNGGCEYLCLPGKTDVTCACPDNIDRC